MLTKSTAIKFYKRKEVQEALVEHARDKEIGIRYTDTFGKRPDMLMYPREVLELALQSATSFHCSEELWENPLLLTSDLQRAEMNALRKGWDLVLDIDCAFLEYSKIAAMLIIRFLRYCSVRDFSVKFSGNKGFHIGVPFEAFPRQVGQVPTKDLFPEAPRKIALYIREQIKQELGTQILAVEGNDFSKVKEKVGKNEQEIIRYEKDALGSAIPLLNVDSFLEVDTVLLASRHLYRMSYSLHEKSGLVSMPLDPDKVLEFRKEMARPELILPPLLPYLPRVVQEGSAHNLLLQALDFKVKQAEEARREKKEYEEIQIQSPITEEFFPPCMQAICRGMRDGRKRGLFCLINFLGKAGWSKQDIDDYVHRWNNEKNPEPLREVYLRSQLSRFKAGERLPPNCDTEGYYQSMGIACNAEHCPKFKNPVNYTLWKWRRRMREKEEEAEKKVRRKEEK